jgi:hypothetical protein
MRAGTGVTFKQQLRIDPGKPRQGLRIQPIVLPSTFPDQAETLALLSVYRTQPPVLSNKRAEVRSKLGGSDPFNGIQD